MTSLPDTLATLLDRIATQAGTIATQAEVIAQLRGALAPPQNFGAIGHFSPHEGILLSAVLRWDVATYDQLLQALYAGRVADEPDQDILKVQICRLRNKLAVHGVTIENAYRVGYRMPPSSKARLRAIMAGVSA